LDNQASLLRIDLSKVTYLALNLDEGYLLTGEKRPQAVLDRLSKLHRKLKTALTLGKNGSFYSCGNLRLRQCAFACPQIDATCAGDAFYGHFISRMASGASPWTALRHASQAAALAVAREGSYSTIPSREEVLAYSAIMESLRATTAGEAELRQ
jgi:ribokinase